LSGNYDVKNSRYIVLRRAGRAISPIDQTTRTASGLRERIGLRRPNARGRKASV
jgi:hypothetical protein